MIDFYEFLQFSLLASRAHHITFLPTKIVLENASIENLELQQSKPLKQTRTHRTHNPTFHIIASGTAMSHTLLDTVSPPDI